MALEALKCATILDGMRLVTIGDKTLTHDKHVYAKNSRWASNLRTWGEAKVVKEGKDNKTGSKGMSQLFVGYPANQEADSMRMWIPDTNGVVTSRYVIWLKRMFFEHKVEVKPFNITEEDDKKVEAKDEVKAVEEIEDDWIPDLIESAADDEVNDADVESAAGETDDQNAATTWSGRTIQAPTRLTAQARGGLEDFQGTVVKMKYLGYMAELGNAEITTAAVAEKNIEISLWELESEVDSTTQAS